MAVGRDHHYGLGRIDANSKPEGDTDVFEAADTIWRGGVIGMSASDVDFFGGVAVFRGVYGRLDGDCVVNGT